MSKPTAIVYIDGLNLQRRIVDPILAGGWVDYWALSQSVLPNFDLLKVRVFTSVLATVDATLAETRWLQQQEVQPNLSIHLGRIKKTTRIYPLTFSNEISTESGSVKVLKYEEKGSDVALAANMVHDAFTEGASIYYVS
jgi:hypothetical protein